MKKLLVLVVILMVSLGFAQDVNTIYNSVEGTQLIQSKPNISVILSPLSGNEIRQDVGALKLSGKQSGFVVIQSKDNQTIVWKLNPINTAGKAEYRATFLNTFVSKVGDGYVFNRQAFQMVYDKAFSQEAGFGSGAPNATVPGVHCTSNATDTSSNLVCTDNGAVTLKVTCTLNPDSSVSCDSNTY